MSRTTTVGGKTRVTGIMGWPVSHSLSPAMHNAAYAALGLDFVYVPFAVRAEDLAAAVAGLRALAVAGINVTIPHKVAVATLLDDLTLEARLSGAVNTIVRDDDGRLLGHNTDGAGFLAALAEEVSFAPPGKRVVILGAGGAARAVTLALASGGAASIHLVNRDGARACAVRGDLAPIAPLTKLTAHDDDRSSLARHFASADLVVNCTSVGMRGDDFSPRLALDALPAHALVADVVYRNGTTTPLVTAARARGLSATDGLSMLVHQAAIAQALWTGHPPPLNVLFAAARS